jgi:predicted ribosome quality control (RQC) complex YloA/Tae2 family protein
MAAMSDKQPAKRNTLLDKAARAVGGARETSPELQSRLDKMTNRLDRQQRLLRDQTRRIEELEAAVEEQRTHAIRLAQLTDLVQELLIPVESRDEARLRQLLSDYSASL